MTPFGVQNVDDYMPPPPQPFDSVQYADDVNETNLVGARNSLVRIPDQTQTAFFWADEAGSVSPAGRWNVIAQTVAESQGNTLYQNARMFALINIAMADAYISAWNCKFHYNRWRPITAIREADTLGNLLVVQDKTWLPLIPALAD